MAATDITRVQLTDTFNIWRTRFNLSLDAIRDITTIVDTQTGAISAISSSGITTRTDVNQDGITLLGRAGGTGNFSVSFTPTTLTANRTITIPDSTTTLVGTDVTQALSNKTYNGLSVTTTTGTLTLANAKTLTVNNSLAFSGTDGTTMSFPATSATIARTDAAQTFTGTQTFTGLIDVANFSYKTTVRAATTANIALSGTQNIDGIVVAAGDRVLVKNQTTASQNGIYNVSAGAWTRAVDADTSADIAAVNVGVQSGTVNGGRTYVTTFKSTETLGTTAMNWFQEAIQGAPASFTTIAATGQFSSTQANNAATGAGQIFLNGATGNRIDFNINGVAPPAFTTRSAGTKIVLYPAVAAASADYALGIENNTMWFSVATTATEQFKWYAGTTNIATLTGAGAFSSTSASFGGLTATGAITANTTTNAQTHSTSTGNISFSTTTTGNISLSTTTGQTGSITINSAGGTGNINNMNIGATTRGTGAFTSLDANAAVTFGATTQAINIGTAQTSGTVTIGSTGGTGTITIGQSTAAQNINIGTGATANATTRTIAIGNAGAAGSTTTISIGGGAGTSTTTLGGSVTANSFSSTGVTITGGSINGTTIGGTTAAAGSFTTLSASGTISLNNSTIQTNQTTVSLLNATATTVNAFGAASAITLGANAGTLTIGSNTLVGTQATQNVFNTVATTLNIGGAATAVSIGATTGTTSINNNLTVTGNLVVNGTTVTVNSTTTTLDDPIITLGGDTAPTVDDNKDRGVEFRWHNGTTAKVGFFGFDDSTGYFAFYPDATNTNEVFSGTLGDIQATNFRGALIGNADTASKWATARTITLAGDLSGSVSIDGSANVTLTATVAANSVALGTDTTGNYVATIAAGTSGAQSGTSGLTISAAAGEGTAATIAHADTSAVADLTAATNTFITAETYDTYGHVLSRTTGTVDFTVAANHAFQNIAVSGQTTVVADSNTDTLTLANGTGVSITTNATNDTITIGTNATSANTANTIVLRDGTGNFSAGTITASLNGNASTATTATNVSGGTASVTTLSTTGNATLGDAGTDTTTINSQVSVNGSVGTTGQVLTSRGPNLSPQWTLVNGAPDFLLINAGVI